MSRRKLSRVRYEPIGGASNPTRLDLDQAFQEFLESDRCTIELRARGNATMDSVRWIISTAPEIFLLLSVAIGTMFVPFVAPKLMRIDLEKEAAKLEAELSGGSPPKSENLAYRKFQARAYRVSAGAGRTVKAIEDEVGGRTVIERIVRKGADVQPHLETVLEDGDDIVIAGQTAAIVAAAPFIGTEIHA